MSGGVSQPAAAVILAAGLSSRMGLRNKLLARDDAGSTMIGRVVLAALASRADEVVVVTGHQAEAVTQAVLAAGAGTRMTIVRSPNYADGLSASLRAGIEAVRHAAAALICLGDMPLVTAAMLDAVIAAHDPAGGRTIVVPTCLGVFGNPVLWNRGFFGELAGLSGDKGARTLLVRHARSVAEVELNDDAVLRDFDTPEAFGPQ